MIEAANPAETFDIQTVVGCVFSVNEDFRCGGKSFRNDTFVFSSSHTRYEQFIAL